MNVLIIVCSLLAVSSASPILQSVEPQTRFLFYPNPMDAPIRHQEYESFPDGSYQWSYETGNGIVGQELSYFKKLPDSNEKVVNVQGSFSYVGDDGVQISLTYTADENGFHPEGAHLPTPPPTPDYILKALKYIAESSTSRNDIL